MATYSLPRSILNMLNISSFFPQDSFQFMVDLTTQMVEQRKSNPEKKYNDLIQLLIDSFTYEEDLANKNYDLLAASIDNDGRVC